MAVIIADTDKEYCIRLAAALNRHLPDICPIPCWNRAMLEDQIHGLHESTLLIINPMDFFEIGDLSFEPGRVISRITLDSRNDDHGQRDNMPIIARTGSVVPLIGRIRLWLDEQSIRPGSETRSPSQEASEQGGLHFMLSLGSGENCAGTNLRKLQRLKNHSEKMIYLPLMPTYQMNIIHEKCKGPSLSDLLLHLDGHEPASICIGHHLQPHRSGFLFFRPPDRSDDLITCHPDILRKLILSVKDYQRSQQEKTEVLIECAGLPLSAAAAAAVLCDTCEVQIGQGAGYSTQAARYEAARLLASLPASCRIITPIAESGLQER